jgi:hypothetical protein
MRFEGETQGQAMTEALPDFEFAVGFLNCLGQGSPFEVLSNLLLERGP